MTHAVEPSILAFVRRHLDDGTDLANVDLPDEPSEPGRLRFAPGARDGIGIHHTAGGSTDPAGALAAAIREACRTGEYTRVEDLARDPDLFAYIDALLNDLRADRPDRAALYGLARWLATESARRGPVKLGIALLGMFPVRHDRDVLLALGRHDEFTLYAAVALANGQADADADLWELARAVHGWGRIQVVERLARTSRPEILDWILRDGFRNSIMYEYLAHTAATRGGLLDRLRDRPVDDDLLLAAADLIQALILGGPAKDISDYADGAAATRAYVDLVADAPTADLRHLIATDAVRRFAAEDGIERGWPPGWTDDFRRVLAEDCAAIAARPVWADLADDGLRSDELTTFWTAEHASRILGRSTVDVVMRVIRRDPLEPGPWYRAANLADEATIDGLTALAVELLPLEAIASGPADELGHGRPYAAHQCLGSVVKDLGRWPGRGWSLVAAALASPVIHNRNQAISVLIEWPRDAWPDAAEPALQSALRAEPTDKIRQRLADLLS